MNPTWNIDLWRGYLKVLPCDTKERTKEGTERETHLKYPMQVLFLWISFKEPVLVAAQ